MHDDIRMPFCMFDGESSREYRAHDPLYCMVDMVRCDVAVFFREDSFFRAGR